MRDYKKDYEQEFYRDRLKDYKAQKGGSKLGLVVLVIIVLGIIIISNS